MKIKPLAGIIYLKIEEPKAGVLDTSSKPSAIEYAEVLAVGEFVEGIKKGDKVFVKAWAIDSIFFQDKKYYFVAEESNGILAVVE